jgi:putative RNA 2'-phosphotransferase
MDDRQRKAISKFLSLVLRHRPGLVGIRLDEAGWVAIDDLLAGCRQAGRTVTREQLDEVVATNDKKRFELTGDGRRIRACQGHSVPVELGCEPARPPDVLYHGTARRNIGSIRSRGLVKGRRHHVHLSLDEQTARKVGGRHGRPVVLRILAGRMHDDGREFFLSANGVWLTDSIPPEYIELPGAADG